MGVITPAEGTFKRSEVLRERDRMYAPKPALGALFWIGLGLFALGFLWLLLG